MLLVTCVLSFESQLLVVHSNDNEEDGLYPSFWKI